MSAAMKISCSDIGVDHGGYVSGTSLDDFVKCVEKSLKADTGLSDEEIAASRDLIRSALLQSCGPKRFRSIRLLGLIADAKG